MHSFLNRRMARGPFWNAVMLTMMAGPVIFFIALRLLFPTFGFKIYPVVQLIGVSPYAILGTRRLHDTNHSGWPLFLLIVLGLIAPYLMATGFWMLFLPSTGHAERLAMEKSAKLVIQSIYPMIAIMMGLASWIIYWWCQPGDADGNRYGPPPGGETPTNPNEPEDPAEVAIVPVARSSTASAPVQMAPQKRSFGRRAS